MMNDNALKKNNRQIAVWLLIGVAMIVVQVLVGGITRLTESGLSITEWKPITGALPPLSDVAWQIEFDKYRNTDQFKYVHQYFSLDDFKFIFFWEWFHRLWARMIGVVFIIGFTYFLLRKKFNRKMIAPMVILFLLGGVQGAIGWIMVKSGLVPEKYFVGHVELTTHFIAALVLLSYTLWFALRFLPSFQQKVLSVSQGKTLYFLLAFIFIQLVYGAFMAGLKAAAVAPTWPSINGLWLPSASSEYGSMMKNIVNNPLLIHFIHRSMGYLIGVISLVYFIRSRKQQLSLLCQRLNLVFILLVLLQIILGISALLYSTQPSAFVYFGVAHQFVAMMIVMCLTSLLYLHKKDASSIVTA
jgi:cytochrome c oxidase assembly protein subunit 15